jgi:hypothetical protein
MMLGFALFLFPSSAFLRTVKKFTLDEYCLVVFQGEIPLQGDFSAEHMIFGGN